MALVLAYSPATADEATIEAVEARRDGATWTFSVTLRHGDIGWYDYADGWRVVAEDGTEFGVRTLLHPHVNEQPFTRSLSDVAIPDATSQVFVEARTFVEGWGAARFPVDLSE